MAIDIDRKLISSTPGALVKSLNPDAQKQRFALLLCAG